MSDATSTAEHEDHDEAHDAHHPSDSVFIKTAVILGLITAVEIAWPYIFNDGVILMAPLLVMMAIKFVIIAGVFMHLKFDSKILTQVFYAGLVLAVLVYLAALVTFDVFRGW